MHPTRRSISWKDLLVYADGPESNTLGELLSNPPSDSIRDLEVKEYSLPGEWPGHFVAAPGEDPAWDTPRVPVDWAGFVAAVRSAQMQQKGHKS